jgi:MFS transporter, SP family, xylose:H+ symportor
MEKGSIILRISMIAAIGGFLFGYDTAVINGAIGPLTKDFMLTPALTGWATGSALIGCVIGAAIAGMISRRLGRKKALMIAAFLFFISALGSAIPESVTQLVLARIIGGMGVGIASMVSPMYIAEVSPSDMRGRLVSSYQLAIVVGILIVFFVNFLIADFGTEQWVEETGWRWMFASEMIPAALFFILIFTVPNSPRWLVLKNKIEEAKNVLMTIRSKDIAEKELKEIQDSLEQEKAKKSHSLLKKGVPKLVLIGILLAFFQQVTGINVIMYYGTEIFRSMGGASETALLQTILVGIVNLIFTLVAIKTIDRFGRKPLIIIGSVGMFIGIMSLSFFIYFKSFGILSLISVLIFIASFAMSLGPVVWVMVAEIFPNSIRDKAMSIAVAANWISNYLVAQTFPIFSEDSFFRSFSNGAFPFWLYGSMCILTIIFTLKYLPETKGRTLEDMEKVFGIENAKENPRH